MIIRAAMIQRLARFLGDAVAEEAYEMEEEEDDGV
jgi:hypothetical protein